MKNLIQAAAITLFAASTVQAQQAVQWKASEGGNGHWYRLELSPMGWSVARSAALAKGGDLASLETDAEFNWVRVTIPGHPWPSEGCHLGGIQASSSPTPDAGWSWLTGGPVAINVNLDVDDNPCGQGCCGENNEQNFLHAYENWQKLGDENEGAFSPTCPGSATAYASIIEWSADCNNDGIVDYGQCRDGSLPDYNGNNVPDCCEAGSPCVVGNYPVEWRPEDGGNGHWYLVSLVPSGIAWSTARDRSVAAGGHLATVTSNAETAFLALLANRPGAFPDSPVVGPWIGGYLEQAAGTPPTWRWANGEPWLYSNWLPPNPDGPGVWNENRTCLTSFGARWNDFNESGVQPCCRVAGYVVEWSADCNNDGIVDKGQILRGQLQDADSDGVPDVCQQPTCRDADFFPDRNINGVDLGVLLSQWGPPTQYTVADLNRDGAVDGIDLGLFLSFWGPCPY